MRIFRKGFKRIKRFNSLRWRLTVSYLLLAVLTSGTFGILSFWLIKNYTEKREQDYLVYTADNLVQEIKPLFADGSRIEEIQKLVDAAGVLSDVRISILDKKKEIILDSCLYNRFRNLNRLPFIAFSSHGSLKIFPSKEKLPPFIIKRGFGALDRRSIREIDRKRMGIETVSEKILDNRSEHVIIMTIGERDKPLGYVRLSEGPDFSGQVMSTALNAFILAFLGAGLVAVLLGLYMGRRLTAPIVNLNDKVSLMSEMNLDVRVPESREDEIGQLSKQFNKMADRLQKSFEEISQERDTLKKFIADASHELRTPVTALKTFNELLQGKAGEKSATRKEFLSESSLILSRLEWIIKNLLDISRFDAGLVILNYSKTSPSEIIRAALNSVKSAVDEKELKITTILDEGPPEIVCDRERIELALMNLFDNSVRYLSRGGELSVDVKEKQGYCVFIVRDNGSGIRPEDLPYIFKRFYRSPNDPGKGTGLGLAIVRSIVEAHGGSVSAESELSRSSTFNISIPLHPPQDDRNSQA